MQCPKCKELLVDSLLSEYLPVKSCPTCQGSWINGDQYLAWQREQPDSQFDIKDLNKELTTEAVPANLDNKAGLCPECRRILSRGKVSIKNPFYVERCQGCNGTWCDRGEWYILEKLGLHTHIEDIFSSTWQNQIRTNQLLLKEKQALIDKVGEEIAEQVFQLSSIIDKHPNGDFAAAYLLRRFDRTVGNNSK
jgi:Zn-finger nucleic acid-binding protein